MERRHSEIFVYPKVLIGCWRSGTQYPQLKTSSASFELAPHHNGQRPKVKPQNAKAKCSATIEATLRARNNSGRSSPTVPSLISPAMVQSVM